MPSSKKDPKTPVRPPPSQAPPKTISGSSRPQSQPAATRLARDADPSSSKKPEGSTSSSKNPLSKAVDKISSKLSGTSISSGKPDTSSSSQRPSLSSGSSKPSSRTGSELKRDESSRPPLSSNSSSSLRSTPKVRTEFRRDESNRPQDSQYPATISSSRPSGSESRRVSSQAPVQTLQRQGPSSAGPQSVRPQSVRPQSERPQSQAPATVKSIFTRRDDATMATRQMNYDDLGQKEKAEQDKWLKETVFSKLKDHCPFGLGFERHHWYDEFDGWPEAGFRCKGGSHWVPDWFIAEGWGGMMVLCDNPELKFREHLWGPYYPSLEKFKGKTVWCFAGSFWDERRWGTGRGMPFTVPDDPSDADGEALFGIFVRFRRANGFIDPPYKFGPAFTDLK